MNIEIPYQGYSTSPSDRQVPDGALATSLNLLYEDGALRPIPQPEIEATIPNGYRILLVHSVQNVKYIFLLKDHPNTSILYCCSFDNIENIDKWQYLGEFSGLPTTWSIVGNIVIISFKGDTFDESDGLCYFRWRQGQYVVLGSHPPFIPIEFGWGNSRNEQHSSEATPVDAGAYLDGTIYVVWKQNNGSNWETIKSHIGAAYNKAISAHESNGRIAHSLLLRYGLRLYDGAYAYLSPPILLPAEEAKINLHIACGDSHGNDARCFASATIPGAQIGYKTTINDILQKSISIWEDVITDIDVFVSMQIYDIDINDPGDSSVEVSYPTGNGRSDFSEVAFIPKKYDAKQRILEANTFYKIASLKISTLLEDNMVFRALPLPDGFKISNIPTYPTLDEEVGFVNKTVVDASFAFNRRLNISSVESSLSYPIPFTLLYPYRYCLPAGIASANSSFGSSGWPIRKWGLSMTAINAVIQNIECYSFKDGVLAHISSQNLDSFVDFSNIESTSENPILLKDENNQVVLNLPLFIFYPEQNARWLKITIVCSGEDESLTAGECITLWLGLTTHDFLPGSYWMPSNISDSLTGISAPAVDKNVVIVTGSGSADGPWKNRNDHFVGGDENEDDNNDNSSDSGDSENPDVSTLTPPDVSGAVSSVLSGNKVMTSRANNPFVFPYVSTTTVGDGEVRALAAPTQALSQGQFGQFPLYAFCTDGVWALETASDGSFVAKQPISRDVILPNTIPTQADHAIFFNTSRGVMCLQGAQTTPISDIIDSKTPFDVTRLPGMGKLYNLFATQTAGPLPSAADTGLSGSPLFLIPFNKFIENALSTFDYTNQRLLIYNANIPYAYVFSMTTRQWGMMVSNLSYSIQSYPDAWAVNKNNELVNLSSPYSDGAKGFYITRPLKLDTPDMFKTIRTIIQRGEFNRGGVSTILYGSNDLRNWLLIWSSVDNYLRGFSGSPFKYYRIAGIATLSLGESVAGASVQFTPRLTNQPR